MEVHIHTILVCLAYVMCFRDVNAGLSCLACTDSPRSRDCQYTTRCGAHESCFTDTYVTTVGTIRHSMGCRDTQQCNLKLQMVGRSTNNVLICSECCQGNLCNSAICGAEKGYLSVPLTARGPICFSCDQQLATDSCHVIKECGIQEECMLKRFETQVGHDIIYQTDCVHITECDENLHKYQTPAVVSNNIIGRRSSPHDACLLKCCRSDLCNEDCTGDRVVFSSSLVNTIPTTNTHTSGASATSTASTTSSTASTTSSTASTTSVASTSSTLPSPSSSVSTTTSAFACTVSAPDDDFCRNKDNIHCEISLEFCHVTTSSSPFRNRCVLKKAMCDDKQLIPTGCTSC